MHLGSLESTQEARVARGVFTFLLYSPDFPPASIARYTHVKREQILNNRPKHFKINLDTNMGIIIGDKYKVASLRIPGISIYQISR